MFLEKPAAFLLVAIENGRRHQGDGHDFSSAHLGLPIIMPASGFKKVITETVDCDDLPRHGNGLLGILLGLLAVLGTLFLHGGPRGK